MRFVWLALLLLFTACSNRESENLVRATALYPQGREVFERYNCMRCHNAGEGGYGKRMIGNSKLRDDKYIRNRILQGKKIGAAQMPAFGAMTEKELQQVAKFVRALAGFE